MQEPPKNLEDQKPAHEADEPLFDEYEDLMGVRRSYLTVTGCLWIFFPWYLLLKKKLKYSLLESWIAALFWAMSSGTMVLGLKARRADTSALIVLLYCVFHSHCLAFTAALYNLKRWEKSGPKFGPARMLTITFYTAILFLLWAGLGGLMLQGR